MGFPLRRSEFSHIGTECACVCMSVCTCHWKTDGCNAGTWKCTWALGCKSSYLMVAAINSESKLTDHSPTEVHKSVWFGHSSVGLQITADGHFSHEIKRHLLFGRKVMTNLDSILKSRNITLPTKIHLVKGMLFPVVLYGCGSGNIKKAEQRRIHAFEV